VNRMKMEEVKYMNMHITRAKLVKMMDVTLLSSQTTYEDIKELWDNRQSFFRFKILS